MLSSSSALPSSTAQGQRVWGPRQQMGGLAQLIVGRGLRQRSRHFLVQMQPVFKNAYTHMAYHMGYVARRRGDMHGCRHAGLNVGKGMMHVLPSPRLRTTASDSLRECCQQKRMKNKWHETHRTPWAYSALAARLQAPSVRITPRRIRHHRPRRPHHPAAHRVLPVAHPHIQLILLLNLHRRCRLHNHLAR